MTEERRGRSLQLLGSLIGAALIVVLTVLVVAARIGPGGLQSEPREERLEELQEEADDRARDRGRSRGRSRD